MTPSERPVRHGPYPEMTWPAVLVGWGLGAMIAISIGYASLTLGFSIEGSELAAILGWGILRGLLGRTSIIENNVNQTTASAVNGASSGMMFSVPALFILAKDFPEATDFNPIIMVLCCITGAVVGLSFVIPLRKQMIDYNRLPYPGGIAVAAILRSPGAGIQKAKLMLGAALFSGLAHLPVLITDVHYFDLGAQVGLPSYLNLTFYISVMTIGVGFLSGRGGLWFGAGGFICYWLLAPFLSKFGSEGVLAYFEGPGVPGALRGNLFLPAGIGVLIGAAVGSIVFAAPMIVSALKSMQRAAREAKESDRTVDEMPIKLLYLGVGIGTLLLIFLASQSVPEVTLMRAAAMAVLGVLWVWIAGVIVSECVGRTNWSPLSGMTLIAVTILVLVAQGGLDTTQTIVASIMMGGAICVAISQASDMMLDLKSGYLVGAKPRVQAFAQYAGTWLGPIVIMALIFVLDDAYGFGSDEGNLEAPQGAALATTVKGLVGGGIPEYRYYAGATLGLLFALSGMGGIGVLVGLGFYMPFAIVLTYTLGNFARMICDRTRGSRWIDSVGIPVAAGLIVGEALFGVGNAVIKIVTPWVQDLI